MNEEDQKSKLTKMKESFYNLFTREKSDGLKDSKKINRKESIENSLKFKTEKAPIVKLLHVKNIY